MIAVRFPENQTSIPHLIRVAVDGGLIAFGDDWSSTQSYDVDNLLESITSTSTVDQEKLNSVSAVVQVWVGSDEIRKRDEIEQHIGPLLTGLRQFTLEVTRAPEIITLHRSGLGIRERETERQAVLIAR